MELKQKANIHNRFDIEVRDAVTGELKQEATAYNIILDQMWTRLCEGYHYFSNIHFGTGAGTPTAARTSLFTHLGTKAAVDDTIIKALPTSTRKRKIVLNPEEFVGSTLTEVGIAFWSHPSDMVTHAILKDAEGNPISILKTATDVITIFATVFITLPNLQGLQYLNMPNDNTLLNYLLGSEFPTGFLSLTQEPNSRYSLGNTSSIIWSTDIPNKQRKSNTLRLGVTVGNGHIQAFRLDSVFAQAIPATDIFLGQNYAGVPIGVGDGVKVQFAIPSANVDESTIVIKSNGVPVTHVMSTDKKYIYTLLTIEPAFRTTDTASGIAMSKDEKIIAISYLSSLKPVRVFDITDDAKIVERVAPETYVNAQNGRSVALGNNGLRIACGLGVAPWLKTFDWVDGGWVRQPIAQGPTSSIGKIAFSENGLVMIAVESGSDPIYAYDWVNGEWVRRPKPAHLAANNVQDLFLSKDGNTMVLGSYGSPPVEICDWISNAWVRRPSTPVPQGTSVVLALDIANDGKTLALAHNSSPRCSVYDWVVDTWIKRENTGAPWPDNMNQYRINLSKDGKTVFVPDYQGYTNYCATWDGVSWNPITMELDRNTQYRSSGLVSETSKYLMYVGSYSDPVNMFKSVYTGGVTLSTPPALGEQITADYKVNGLHKTNQYVVDVSCAIQFGEGV